MKFKDVLEDLISDERHPKQQDRSGKEIEKRIKDSEQKAMNIFKVVHNKRKIDLSCSMTAGQQVAIITISDITQVKKYEKQK